MFLGEYNLPFTGQGRIILPKKFREELGEDQEIILSRGLDGCIWGFIKSQWEKEAHRQLSSPITERQSRGLRRYLFSAAESVSLDHQGRFIIPKNLYDFAKLRDKVVLAGVGDHFEIWDIKLWQKVIKQLIKNTG